MLEVETSCEHEEVQFGEKIRVHFRRSSLALNGILRPKLFWVTDTSFLSASEFLQRS